MGPVRQNFHFPADFGQFLAGGSNLTPPPPSRLGLNGTTTTLASLNLGGESLASLDFGGEKMAFIFSTHDF